MKKIIFLLSCFFLMINSTWAITISCPELASVGEEIRCKIEDSEYIGIKANYKIGNEFIYKDFKLNNSWKKYYAGALGFSIGNVSNEEKLDVEVIFEVSDKALVNQEYLIELSDIEVVNNNYQNIKLDNISSKVKILSNVNTLKSLEINNGTLYPKFDSNVTSYETSVSSDKIVIKASPSDDSAIVSGDVGEKRLQYGVNNFVISVTSARGEVRNYYLYVTRKYEEVKKSSDITLKSLIFNGTRIKLEDNNYLYSVNVAYDVNDINIEAIPNSEKASVVIEKPESLAVGENSIVVVVTAEDGSIGKYVIIVKKYEKLSSDATIKSLTIDGYDLNFKSDTFDYELAINNEDKLDIEVVLNDSKARYTISGNNKLVNNSVINIQVVAEDGSFENYRIKILKEDEFNSSSIVSGVSLFALVSLVILVTLVIVVKIITDKTNQND